MFRNPGVDTQSEGKSPGFELLHPTMEEDDLCEILTLICKLFVEEPVTTGAQIQRGEEREERKEKERSDSSTYASVGD